MPLKASVWDGVLVEMSKGHSNSSQLLKLINQLDHERSWLLEQIDKGRWAQLRLDLAGLERELAQFLTSASEKLDNDS